MKNIKNIIFDLGGVIINLDPDRTLAAFNAISALPFQNLYNPASQSALFDQFDKGTISEADFFADLRKQIRFNGPDEDLYQAWNAMLLDVPEERLEVLVDAKQDYRTFLLSNTNETHITAFEHELYQQHGVRNFADYFDEVYYSCRTGMRKPDAAIFEMVLNKNKLRPEETVFIDDSVQHVKGAGQCGINAYLLPKGTELGDLLTQLGLL